LTTEKVVLVGAAKRQRFMTNELKAALVESNQQIENLSNSYKELLAKYERSQLVIPEDAPNTFITNSDVRQH
jgi:hypothetical protein